MLTFCPPILLLLIVACCQCSPIVDLGYVKYEGFQNAPIGINYFRGIRCSQAPSDNLRWQAPVQIEKSNNYNGQTLSAFKMIFDAGSQLHGASGPFLFNNISTLPSSAAVNPNVTISDILTSYFISFVVSSDPNPMRDSKAPFWPSYASGALGNVTTVESVGFRVLEITDTDVVVTLDRDVNPQCDFFSAHEFDTRN
jgi:hypothetical protein